ncbi:GH92 family glycosyl hydrolase [Actinomadura madurae]|uniref:GH92 family glycosyl hydrolase n=1 Tax=Actinomadura madurae TaxID=1993 RepID=UPI000D8B3CFB|nr:GH92 family glycosyl hydrolase [Actinomadura madurae]SPT57429.1 Putative alpha-1,2-mannosidase [Actinomadura madurae]
MLRRRLAGGLAVLLLPLASAAVPAATAAHAAPDLTSYVNPFVGTKDGGPDFGHGGGAGMNFPGAAAPFGMMQWSPDTVRTSGGGYKYEDDRLRGFSMSHISGPGCTGAQDFPVIPISGTIGASPATHGSDYVQTFKHENEQANPGYYAVTADSGVKTELTASTRAGVGRFTFPAGKPGTLLLNVTGSINGVDDAEATISGNTVSGWARTGGFCGTSTKYYVYFHATFDRPITASGTWKDDSVKPGNERVRGKSPADVPQSPRKTSGRVNNGRDGRPVAPSQRTFAGDVTVKGPGSGVYLQFDGGTPVQMRTGLSYVSIDGAKKNLRAEIGRKPFDAVRTATRDAWQRRLGQIRVEGGTPDTLRTFYTALYHSFLQPYVFDDVDGTYTGFDYRTHKAPRGRHHYATFSGWDIYRSEIQLLAFLAPDVASDIARSLHENARAIGDVWDRWSHQNTITGVMNGDPYHSMIASAYAFGARDFDAKGALASMVAGAERIGAKSGYTERPGNASYLKIGYVPGDPATTMEYNLADFGIAQVAERLGDKATAEKFMARSHGWQNLYNPLNGWIQPRFADGSFLSPFDPADSNWYVEGNGAQYHWMTYADVKSLFNAMGGRDAAAKRLDAFFAELNAGPHKPLAYLGNEPSLQSPWLYAWAGRPYRTQDVVHRARAELFKPTPDGLVGNDDLGTMSAWYVWASLGVYPAIPGRAELMVNGPAFSKIEVRRSSGQKVTIKAPGAETSRYIQALKVNGKATTKAWLPESFARSGGTLDFTLGTSPNTGFGSAESDAPPSFTEGGKSYLTAVDPGLVPVEPGGSTTTTLRVQALASGGEVEWKAAPPPGVTLTPSSGTLRVPASGHADQKITVSVAADAKIDFHTVPISIPGAGDAGLTLNVARKGTIEWYQNNAGISEDGASGMANFDGGGWSYSAQALAAAGLSPGEQVSWNGFTFDWPARRPGQMDNVHAQGQTVELPDGLKAAKLAFLGSAGNGDAPSTVTITYADGSTQRSELAFSDWALGADAYPPRFGNEIVATTPYRNNDDGTRDEINVYVFGATPIDLDPAKQVKSMTLNAPESGGSLHVFAWAFA